ncbi:DUF975 family protein [Schleiferilactobacillus shenzhenensis]|nr:DUF975 family protein [Schleiferilactobacillus shenzhenensis]
MIIPRAALKAQVKARMRGHYGVLFGMTVLPLILLAVAVMLGRYLVIYSTTGARIWSLQFFGVTPMQHNSALMSRDFLLAVLTDLISTSIALGVLFWWRHPATNRSITAIVLTGFHRRYVGGFLFLFILLGVLPNLPFFWLTLLPWWSPARLVWLVVVTFVQIVFFPAFYIYYDLANANEPSVLLALKLSWQLMQGFKLQYFILCLSLLGWLVLCLLFLPLFWYLPYVQLIMAAWYEAMRAAKPGLIPAVG